MLPLEEYMPSIGELGCSPHFLLFPFTRYGPAWILQTGTEYK